MFGGLIIMAALAHLVGLRAERNGRRYWIWFLLALCLGPVGLVLVFLLLEASIRKQGEEASLSKTDAPPDVLGIREKH